MGRGFRTLWALDVLSNVVRVRTARGRKQWRWIATDDLFVLYSGCLQATFKYTLRKRCVFLTLVDSALSNDQHSTTGSPTLGRLYSSELVNIRNAPRSARIYCPDTFDDLVPHVMRDFARPVTDKTPPRLQAPVRSDPVHPEDCIHTCSPNL